MSKYLYVYKTQIIKSLTYKFNVYGNILMQTIIMITTAYFWKALFKDTAQMKGASIDSMLVYTVVSAMMSVILSTNVERRITESVREGKIAMDMIKPVNIFATFLAEDFGSMTALILQNLLPILLIGSLLIGFPKIADIRLLPLFALSMIMSFGINWLMSALFGMWAFTIIEMDALIQVKKHLVRLLSGSIIPMWFFPKWLSGILNCLPFVYIYQLPLDIYIGRYESHQYYLMMLAQAGWLVGLMVIFLIMQSHAMKKVMIQGG